MTEIEPFLCAIWCIMLLICLSQFVIFFYFWHIKFGFFWECSPQDIFLQATSKSTKLIIQFLQENPTEPFIRSINQPSKFKFWIRIINEILNLRVWKWKTIPPHVFQINITIVLTNELPNFILVSYAWLILSVVMGIVSLFTKFSNQARLIFCIYFQTCYACNQFAFPMPNIQI